MANEPKKYTRYDYEGPKQVYVEGRVDDKGSRSWPSLQDVADLFEIPGNRLREKAAKDRWTDQRAAFQANLEKVRQEKRLATLSKEAVELDSRALNVAKMGIALVMLRLGEMTQKAQALQKERAEHGQDADDMGFPIADARELETLGRAASAWHSLGGKALGEVETTRTEITGAGGAPVEVQSTIRAELTRDDPNRLHAFLVAVERSGLAGALTGGGPQDAEGEARGPARDGGAEAP